MTKWNISSNGNDGSIAITGVQNKLTQAEIDESVNIVMNEVRKIDGSSKILMIFYGDHRCFGSRL